LEAVRHFKIFEFNGVAAEPAHIYDPSYPFWKKYRDIFQHWEIIYRIWRYQRKKGVAAMTIKEAWAFWKNYQQQTKFAEI